MSSVHTHLLHSFPPRSSVPPFPVSLFPTLKFGATFYTFAFSNLAFLTIPPFPVSRFPTLQYGAVFSSLAFSILAFSAPPLNFGSHPVSEVRTGLRIWTRFALAKICALRALLSVNVLRNEIIKQHCLFLPELRKLLHHSYTCALAATKQHV